MIQLMTSIQNHGSRGSTLTLGCLLQGLFRAFSPLLHNHDGGREPGNGRDIPLDSNETQETNAHSKIFLYKEPSTLEKRISYNISKAVNVVVLQDMIGSFLLMIYVQGSLYFATEKSGGL